jgi:hypothetical protein
VLIRESPGVRGVSYVRVLVGCQTVCEGRDFAGLGVVFMRTLGRVIQRCDRGNLRGEDSGKPLATRKPAQGGLLGVFRRLSETARDCYMVPRRHLNQIFKYMILIVFISFYRREDTHGGTRDALLNPTLTL